MLFAAKLTSSRSSKGDHLHDPGSGGTDWSRRTVAPRSRYHPVLSDVTARLGKQTLGEAAARTCGLRPHKICSEDQIRRVSCRG